MEIDWDPIKNAANIVSKGLDFADFRGFDVEPSVSIDDRFDYGEVRYRAIGRIDGVPHLIVYTRRGDVMRLISFRRAREKEIRRYE